MKPHPVEIIQPTKHAFLRMKWVLFQPFSIGKWFVLGFSAFLASLLSTGSSMNFNFGGGDTGENWGEFTQWFTDNWQVIVIVIAALAVFFLTLYFILLWIGARGKFMLLDNLVYNRALVKQPWREFKSEANSLFFWNLIWGALVLILFLLMAGGIAFLVYQCITIGSWPLPYLAGISALATGLLALFAVYGYIWMLLEDFVIPIMYKHRISTSDAWAKFRPFHASTIWKFVLFALWKIALTMVAGTALFTVGMATCCLGFLLMAIPYIGTVATLPISTFFRFLGPDFLLQFGEEFDILPKMEEYQPPQIAPSIPSSPTADDLS